MNTADTFLAHSIDGFKDMRKLSDAKNIVCLFDNAPIHKTKTIDSVDMDSIPIWDDETFPVVLTESDRIVLVPNQANISLRSNWLSKSHSTTHFRHL